MSARAPKSYVASPPSAGPEGHRHPEGNTSNVGPSPVATPPDHQDSGDERPERKKKCLHQLMIHMVFGGRRQLSSRSRGLVAGKLEDVCDSLTRSRKRPKEPAFFPMHVVVESDEGK